MSKKDDLIDYVVTQLGTEIRQIYITDKQIEQLIDVALEYFEQNASMAVQEFYLSLSIIAQTKDYVMPFRTRSVVDIMGSGNPLDIFSIERFMVDSVMLNNNPSKQSNGSGSYNLLDLYMMRSWIQTARKMMVKEISFRYSEYDQILKLDTTPTSNTTFIIHGYRYLFDSTDTDNLLYTHPWIKQYVLALAWITFGTNLKVYKDVPLPSGMTFDADFALSHGRELQIELKEELDKKYNEPPDFMIG